MVKTNNERGDAMKVNVIPWFFEPTDEFASVIGNRSYREIMFDPLITEYIENNSEFFHGRKVHKGRESSKFRIGFAGCCEVLDVKDNKNWIIKYDNQGRPYIQYVVVETENGYVHLESED